MSKKNKQILAFKDIEKYELDWEYKRRNPDYREAYKSGLEHLDNLREVKVIIPQDYWRLFNLEQLEKWLGIKIHNDGSFYLADYFEHHRIVPSKQLVKHKELTLDEFMAILRTHGFLLDPDLSWQEIIERIRNQASSSPSGLEKALFSDPLGANIESFRLILNLSPVRLLSNSWQDAFFPIVTLSVDLTHKWELIERDLKVYLKGHQDLLKKMGIIKPERERIKESRFQLEVYDLSESGLSFGQIAKKLNKGRTTVIEAYKTAFFKIHGKPYNQIDKDIWKRCNTCPKKEECWPKLGKLGEEWRPLCRPMRRALRECTKGQRELLASDLSERHQRKFD